MQKQLLATLTSRNAIILAAVIAGSATVPLIRFFIGAGQPAASNTREAGNPSQSTEQDESSEVFVSREVPPEQEPTSAKPLPDDLPFVDPASEFSPSSTTIAQGNTGAFPEDLLAQESTGGTARPLEYADRLLLGGNYYGAAINYERRLGIGDNGVGLNLRLGLSNEFTGNLADAAKYYAKAVRHAEINSISQLWALVGLARVWIKSAKYESANSLLSEMLLRYGSDAYPNELRAEIALLLADCIRLSDRDKAPEANLAPIYYRPEPNPNVYLQADQVFEVDAQEDQTNGITLVQLPGKNVSSIVLDIDMPSTLISEMLRNLSSETGVSINTSDSALTQLSGRRTAPQNRILTMAEWLDHVLSPHGLAWRQEDEIVHVSALHELVKSGKSSFLVGRRGRLLREVQVNALDKTTRCVALMHEGNDFYIQMDFKSASEKFQSAKRLKPNGELASILSFNYALLLHKLGENSQSLEALYNALDQSLDPGLRAQCYVLIAKQELASGGIKKAIVSASRGIKLDVAVENRLKSSLVLAKAYLLDNKPHAANQVLFDYSHLLEISNQAKIAGVFASLARLEIVGSRGGMSDESNRLLRSLSQLAPSQISDFADAILVSRSFARVGLSEKAQQMMEEALTKANEKYWQRVISIELAENSLNHNQPAKAEEYLQKIENMTNDQPALLLLAQAKLEQKKADDSIPLCKRLLEFELSPEDAKLVLNTLGKAYQLKGKNRAAALCFSGIVPDLETDL